MSKQQQTAHSAHSKASRLTFPATGQASEYRTKYLYDGLRVIQERDINNVPLVSYTRGTDLSGSLEGAGGIGGLLARSDGYSGGNWANHNCYHADGNGNVTYLVNSSQGLAARYRYDAFGNTLSISGTLGSPNVYRFSSKEIHVNSGMYYYLHRFYDPNLQRWINRDPLGESGGYNLYVAVHNDPVDGVDSWGLKQVCPPDESVPKPPNSTCTSFFKIPCIPYCCRICTGLAGGRNPLPKEPAPMLASADEPGAKSGTTGWQAEPAKSLGAFSAFRLVPDTAQLGVQYAPDVPLVETPSALKPPPIWVIITVQCRHTTTVPD